MATISLYRKYRSQTFGDLIGQDHVVRTLQNALSSDKTVHAYLFTGPRGTGKTSAARLLAKALNCEQGPSTEPCNQCEHCVAITDGSHLDVYEMDAASDAGVDDIRERIVDIVEYKPTTARFKVFVIDEVHDLSPKAFDALLKTVEEPPAHIVFILATTEYNKVPATIRSRCQKYEFHRATVANLVKRLEYVVREENTEAEPAAVATIARMADGGFRDALTLLEQAMITAEGAITVQHVYDQLGLISEEIVDGLLHAMRDNDPRGIMEKVAEVTRIGRDPRSLLESMEYRLADLTRAAYGVDSGGAVDAPRDALLHEAAAQMGKDALLTLRSAIADSHKNIREVSLPRIWLEAELLRISLTLNAKSVAPEPTKSKPAVIPPKAEKTPRGAEAEQPKTTASNGDASSQSPRAVAEAATSPPAGDLASDLWHRIRAELGAISKTMAMKLDGTRARVEPENVLVIEFERQMECDWLLDGVKRQAAVAEKVHAVAGPEWTARFAVTDREAVIDGHQAVELPAEGQRLVQLAKDIIGTA